MIHRCKIASRLIHSKINEHILLQNLAKLQFFLEESDLLCKSDQCFIRRKKTKSKQKKNIFFMFFDFVDYVGFCYTGFI
jgi:hypothetical protein